MAAQLFSVGKGREQLQRGFTFGQINDAVLSVDQRRQLRQQQPSDRRQIPLTLKHVGETREVRLQPILLGVAVRGQPQIVDHRVDVVFEFRHFASGIDLDRARQVALGHGSRDLGNGSHLGRQIGGE